MRTLRGHAASLLVSLTLALPAAMHAQAPVEPYVKSIRYEGTGCPNGSVGQSVANDRRSFTLIYDSFVASAGPGVPSSESAKDCTIVVRLRLTPGWQTLTLAAARRGYVQLPAGTAAQVQAAYSTKAPGGTAGGNGKSGVNETSQTSFAGPVSRDYLRADGYGITIQAPNTCNEVPEREQDLAIRLDESLSGGPNQAQITTDSLDVSLSVVSLAKSNKTCQ